MKFRDLTSTIQDILFWLSLIGSQLFFITILILLFWKMIKEN